MYSAYMWDLSSSLRCGPFLFFINATLRSLDWNIFLVETLALRGLHSCCWLESQHRYYVSVPSVDKQRRIQPFIGCSYEHTVFALHVFSQCASFRCWLRSDTGGIAMAEEVLTPTEVLEIVYNSDESLSDSNSDSVGSSDNEIDDL